MIRKVLGKLRGEPQLTSLKKQGLNVGKNFSYGRYCFFDPSHCFLISIGNDVTFSTRVHILAHDASTQKHLGYTKIGLVNIGNKVFIGANTTILSGVSIGDNSIIGAGSVVSKNIEPNSVYAGVPAKYICSLDEYLKKIRNIDKNCIFDDNYTIEKNMTQHMKNEMKQKLKNGMGLLK